MIIAVRVNWQYTVIKGGCRAQAKRIRRSEVEGQDSGRMALRAVTTEEINTNSIVSLSLKQQQQQGSYKTEP